jgi:cell wall-associated NlpC family hydrolase
LKNKAAMKKIVLYNFIFLATTLFAIISCRDNNPKNQIPTPEKIVTIDTIAIIDSATKNKTTKVIIETPIQFNKADSVVTFAKTLIGTPYSYASTNPAVGFHCSGFITYVYNHFNIKVPRSSVDFTNYGKEVAIENAVIGHLILFTGTDSSSRVVGHMGIITENNNGQIKFIHSTSGKANGVTITPLNEYYKKRFVKIIALP